MLTEECTGGINFLLTGDSGAHEVKTDDDEEEPSEPSEDEEVDTPSSTQSLLSTSHRLVLSTSLLVQVSSFLTVIFLS